MRSFGVRLPILAATAWAGIGLSVLGRELGYSETSTLLPRWRHSRCPRLMSPLTPMLCRQLPLSQLSSRRVHRRARHGGVPAISRPPTKFEGGFWAG